VLVILACIVGFFVYGLLGGFDQEEQPRTTEEWMEYCRGYGDQSTIDESSRKDRECQAFWESQPYPFGP
jgi:hypothetical protein